MSQPGNFGAGWPADESYLVRRVENLEREVRELRAARTLEAATIGAGGITVANGGAISVDAPNGVEVERAGALDAPYNRIDGTPQQGFRLRRESGEDALVLADLTPTTNPLKQALQWIDRARNVVIADDTNSGTGIARPYIPIGQFVDIQSTAIGSTTSATFTDIQWALASRQHPRILAQILVRSDSVGTTGNVRLMDGLGNQVGSTIAVAANSFVVATIGPIAWPVGTWSFSEGFPSMQVQAQRTAGAGTIGAKVIGAWGLQS